MKKLIAWTIDNTPAMNTLMLAILAVGAFSLYSMNRELFPDFELEIVLVTVPYPGATPAEVEEGICMKIEEAVQSIEGIKKVTSIAREGSGSVIVELKSSIRSVQKALNEIESEVNRIPSFPELAEEPEVKQITLREPAIELGLTGPEGGDARAELALRELAEELKRDLKDKLPSVNQVDILGGRDYQIDIEIPERTLREYGLTLQDVARKVRDQNVEMPGGTIRTDAQEILLRGKNKRLIGEEIAELPLVTRRDGVVLTIGELGNVRDEFDDTTAITRVDGRPGLILSVTKTKAEDLIAITSEVRDYMEDRQLPEGYAVVPLLDRSVYVADRLDLLLRNGLQGLVLVFLLLALFLELRLAGWVALGIPIAMMGAGIILLALGQTLNMLSMFAFILTLGILVDDAIVVGENVYYHRSLGKDFRSAAIDGTAEVLPSVTASVSTTIVAFTPMLFVPGVMGKFIFIIPIAVIAMLAVSLLECLVVLPCHLAHQARGLPSQRVWAFASTLPIVPRAGVLPLWAVMYLTEWLLYPVRTVLRLNDRFNRWTSWGLGTFSNRVYLPTLRRMMRWPTLNVAMAVGVLALFGGAMQGGLIPTDYFPSSDSPIIEAQIYFPDGTPAAVTDAATVRLEEAIRKVDKQLKKETGSPVVDTHYRLVGAVGAASAQVGNEGPDGSHRGKVVVELVEPERRDIDSQEILERWRAAAGDFPGVESLEFNSQQGGPGGRAIEVLIRGRPEDMPRIEAAVEETKAQLATYAGVYDIGDDSNPGKPEYRVRVREDAQAMGVSERDLAGTVRAAFYGEEVQRLQRGRHEVKLMVRYPLEERRSIANFDDIRVRTGTGAERPITELADVTVERGYSQIMRQDQQRAITVYADAVSEAKGKATADLENNFLPALLAKPEYRGLTWSWGGQQEDTKDAVGGLLFGLAIALAAMFCLLTLEFKSYLQPAIIMAIIPFGMIGAVIGHLIMGMEVTMMSLFGLVALAGVVVNDSIVLIDFINHRVKAGMPIQAALLDAGGRRLRPILLTSLTTIFGLMPIIFETSFQAQYLKPMAISLSFGLMFSTFLVLTLVPTFYLIYYRLSGGPMVPESGVEPEDAANAGQAATAGDESGDGKWAAQAAWSTIQEELGPHAEKTNGKPTVRAVDAYAISEAESTAETQYGSARGLAPESGDGEGVVDRSATEPTSGEGAATAPSAEPNESHPSSKTDESENPSTPRSPSHRTLYSRDA